jgi:hypothetical protein
MRTEVDELGDGLIGTSSAEKKPQRGARIIASISLRLLYQLSRGAAQDFSSLWGISKTSARSGPDVSSTINWSQEKNLPPG